MTRLRIFFIAIMCCLIVKTNAQSNDERAIREIEQAVKQISRICPTYMWDSWRFRDIMYEKESNTVYFVIQLKNRKKVNESIKKNESFSIKQPTCRVIGRKEIHI